MSFEASVLVLVVTLTLDNLINCVERKTTDDATIQENGGSSKIAEFEVEHYSSNMENYRTVFKRGGQKLIFNFVYGNFEHKYGSQGFLF